MDIILRTRSLARFGLEVSDPDLPPLVGSYDGTVWEVHEAFVGLTPIAGEIAIFGLRPGSSPRGTARLPFTMRVIVVVRMSPRCAVRLTLLTSEIVTPHMCIPETLP